MGRMKLHALAVVMGWDERPRLGRDQCGYAVGSAWMSGVTYMCAWVKGVTVGT